MTATALHDTLSAAGARLGEYSGAQTAAAFSSPQAEFAALRAGCAIFDLGWRAKIILTGADRQRWLNGLVTNNLRDLGVNHGVYCFLLNPQGHILADMYAYNRGDYILVDTDLSQAQKVAGIFDHYIIMDDVEVADAGAELTAIGLQGPASAEVLRTAGIDAGELQPLQVADMVWKGVGISLVRGEFGGYEIWLAPANTGAIWDGLTNAGAVPVGTEALELWRIASGIPKYGVDIRERDLPQETEQERALNFSKGCYVGQEIVERIRSRGAVHRKFTGFRFTGQLPAPGTKVQAGGKDVGELTSVAAVPTGSGEALLGLGYIRREGGAPGTKLQVGTTEAIVTALPFDLN
jgi:folate-binding protein YgfZ